MYTVLIVDDEPIVSVTIKSLARWEDYGISMAYEAYNGKQALKLIDEHPEINIVITDINMPVMDGLVLIGELNKRDTPPAILVLSAYEEYHLLRSAFKLGAVDYILKTEIEAESLQNALDHVIEKLQQKKSEEENRKNSLKSEQDRKLLKERLLRDLLSGNRSEITAEYSENTRLDSQNLTVCFLWADDFQIVRERYADGSLRTLVDAVLESITQILSHSEYGEALSLSAEEYVLLLSFPQLSQTALRTKLNEILTDIRYNLVQFNNLQVSIGVSDPGDGYEKIPELFAQAEKNVRYRFIFGKQRTIYPESVLPVTVRDELSIIPKTERFVESLKKADDSVLPELDFLLDEIDRSGHEAEKTIRYYSEILFTIIKTITDLGEDAQKVFGKDINFYEQLTRFETLEELNRWMHNLVAWVVEYLKDRQGMKLNFAITKALGFLKENFRDENISTFMVSDYVGLSENYFCVLFKQEVGESFTNYLTRLRIDEAKKLMETTNMKIYEISEYVGYRNVEHFSRTFKKVAGKSPNYYKNHFAL